MKQSLQRQPGEILNHLIADYKRRFLVDAIRFRDEIKRRLPHTEEDPNLLLLMEKSYENPVNLFGIEEVVLNLERLAKSLSTKEDN